MNSKLLCMLLLSSALTACGGSDNSPSRSSSSISNSSLDSSSASSEPNSSSANNSSSSSSDLNCGQSSQPDLANVQPLSRSILDPEVSEPELPVAEVPVYVCASGLYFCDDFSANSTDQWNELAAADNVSPDPIGTFDILDDANNSVLRYTAGNVGGVLALVKPEAFVGVTSADYYVEMRIRPRNNSTTGNKQLYLLARYQDADNWYGAGLNVQGATTSTRVAIGKKVAGIFTDNIFARYNTPIVQGTAGLTDGEWYTIRFELKGSDLTVYFNGEQVISGADSSLAATGLIGIYTTNKSFEIDDIKVGNVDERPAQLTFVPANSTYSAEVNDEPRVITVTAKDSLGADGSFIVESSNPAIISVTKNGNEVSLAAVGEGSAVITFTSGSDASLVRTIAARVAPEFVQPVATYNLDCVTRPAANSTNVQVDVQLQLTFDSPPVLGETGAIRIFKASDDSLVDTIKLGYEKDVIGIAGATRELNTLPIQAVGNTVTVALHSNALDYNTTYYVAIGASVFPGATLSGQPFAGIGKQTGWLFTTKATAPDLDATTLSVDKYDASADFGSIQGALNFVMELIPKETPVTININKGVYEELLQLNNKDNVTLRGESRDDVLIQYRNSEGLNGGSDGRNVFRIANSDLVTLENLTVKNTTLIGEGGQAETIYFNSSGRLIAKNSAFISEQDTLQLKGYAWVYQSLIAGSVDFIWGNNHVALFEESEIRSIGRSSGHANGGYILQARTVNATDKGFVFLNSILTRGAGPTNEVFGDDVMWLARSGGSAVYYDNIAFVNTRMDSHIRTAGWATTPTANPATPSLLSGWRQYNSLDINGEPLDMSAWTLGYTLTQQEYETEFSTRAKIFSAYDDGAGWNPQP